VEELISYAGLREQIVNRLAKSKRSTDINLWEAMLAILDLSAVVVNGEGYESQEANEKLYYWLS
jgi:hypothetical protein